MRIKVYIIGIIAFLFSSSIWAQDQQLISLNLNEATIDILAENIEQQTAYRILYNDSVLQNYRFTLETSNQSVPQILHRLLNPQGIEFFIYEHFIFISEGVIFNPRIAEHFFDKDSTVRNTNASSDIGYVEARQFVSDIEQDRTIIIGNRANLKRGIKAELKGRITNLKDGEPIPSAYVKVQNSNLGIVADVLGYYTLQLAPGSHVLEVSSMGMRTAERRIELFESGTLNIELSESVESLKEVEVNADKVSNLNSTTMGVEALKVEVLKNMPNVMGEVDVLRAILTLPGVKSVGEASNGFNVRGGAVDQNLILYNDALVFNPSHLFGFLSSFNSDVLEDVQLYKSSIPAHYGGRLASVLDISNRSGNKKRFSASGGIGLVSGRLMVEGPLQKDKSSFLIAGRGTYSDWLLNKLENEDYNKSKAGFYDLNFGISHHFNVNNELNINAYYSNDNFRFRLDTSYSYNNYNTSVKWKHIFNAKLYSESSLSYSGYAYVVESSENPLTAFNLNFDIKQYGGKILLHYYPHLRHHLSGGISSYRYSLSPGNYVPNSAESIVLEKTLETEQAQESALFLADEYHINENLVLDVGIRLPIYQYLGPHSEFTYAAGESRRESTRQDSIYHASGKIISQSIKPEYRLAIRQSTGPNSSVKASYNTLRQFIHLISNTTAISPTDIWKLSDNSIAPQWGEQYSLGYYQNFKNDLIETSVELYFKRFRNYLDYKSGAQLILNQNLQEDVISSRGKAFGIEFLIKKTRGKLNGWLSYSYSRSLLQTDDQLSSEKVNDGEWYPSPIDKPHDFSAILNYKFTHRVNFSTSFLYSTGRPITLPIAKYQYGGATRVLYSDRNQYRIPDYYRLDISLNLEGNHKVKKLAHSSWSFSIYNLLGRRNAYSIYYSSPNGNLQGYKLSIFGRPIPTITYNFRF